jgi:hypothetical protein
MLRSLSTEAERKPQLQLKVCNAILHSHRRENLKSYIALTGCAL